MTRCTYLEALQRLDLLSRLAAYDPHVAGTPPLGIDLPSSDIDVLCHAPNAAAFAEDLWRLFGCEAGFRMEQWTENERPVIAAFAAHGWTIELFGHPRPVREQAGWRHFGVERRLLDLGGETFRAAVMQRRNDGLKTEPAFAAALGLGGDPYAALLDLERQSDADLAALLRAAPSMISRG
jgi:hypothetical protein